MLFSRCVSGTRTVPTSERLEVGGIAFEGYGAHLDRHAGSAAFTSAHTPRFQLSRPVPDRSC